MFTKAIPLIDHAHKRLSPDRPCPQKATPPDRAHPQQATRPHPQEAIPLTDRACKRLPHIDHLYLKLGQAMHHMKVKTNAHSILSPDRPCPQESIPLTDHSHEKLSPCQAKPIKGYPPDRDRLHS